MYNSHLLAALKTKFYITILWSRGSGNLLYTRNNLFLAHPTDEKEMQSYYLVCQYKVMPHRYLSAASRLPLSSCQTVTGLPRVVLNVFLQKPVGTGMANHQCLPGSCSLLQVSGDNISPCLKMLTQQCPLPRHRDMKGVPKNFANPYHQSDSLCSEDLPPKFPW